MKIGDHIKVCACKADGTVYRSWHTMIESVGADSVVTISPAGGMVEDRKRITYQNEHILRSYYWFERFYNLIEVFDAQGNLVEIYINIASPPEIKDGVMSFKDHELDVSKYPPNPARLIDEDEFAEAAIKYNYTKEFQDKMYLVAEEALALANHWKAKPVPHHLITHSHA
jgi:protein associated with RNAse G/E